MRILSLHPATTELVFALGAGNQLVGRTDYCTYPEAALSIPSIGKPSDISSDTVQVFEPDLILIGPGQKLEFASAWKTVRLAPESLEGISTAITSLGALLGKHVEADMLVHELTTTLERVKTKCSKFHTLRTYFEVCEMTPPYIAELIALAQAEPYVGEFDVDNIKAFNPQMLIVAADEQYTERVLARDGWNAIAAVQYERVFTVDEGLFRPTPRIVQGAKLLAKLLHGVEVN